MSERYTVARLTREGERFEILVKPQPAFSYRLGKIESVSQVLVTDTIFTDANKGLKPSEDKLLKAFGTTDLLKIASLILKKGALQLTTEQRRQFIEDKRKQIVSFISRQCVDPRTNLPHPPIRVERAMEQVHFSVDPFKKVEEQAKEVVKLLRPVLPLKMERVSVALRIPPEHANRIYGTVKGFGTIKREEWRADGSWFAVVELPAGLYGSFLEKLGEMTRGNLEAKMVK
ncbi:MAG: ribosome assembly factor SBDS [Candidatus Bathyarchaeota archaeon]|nr:MAG: ribosome assembly factor SBDS [Candidatus Bathyarchaeota archaeon]